MKVLVDEIDVRQVAVGQPVRIRVDALPDAEICTAWSRRLRPRPTMWAVSLPTRLPSYPSRRVRRCEPA